MNYTSLLPTGRVSITVKSAAEAQIALKELRMHKKDIQLQKKEISGELRRIRTAHTDVNLRRGSKMPGGGWIGRMIRIFQTASRDNHRYDLATKTAPLEGKKQYLEAALISIDKATLLLEKYIATNP